MCRRASELGGTVKHVLIIEDNSLIAKMIGEHLRDSGFTSSDFAQTQDEAIHLAAQRRPDLITSDDRLRQGSGVEAVRSICHREPIPVVFVVADPAHVQETIPNAIVLLKPFSGESLEIAIQTAEKQPLILS